MGLFKKRCKTYGCPNIHSNVNGYCDECNARRSYSYLNHPVHPAKRSPDLRPSASQRGYDASWHKFASEYLSNNPVCAICGRPAQCVDHKDVPAEVMMDMYGSFDLDPTHYQPLCFSCNQKKAAQDRQVIRQYFQDKEALANGKLPGATPGGGVKTPDTSRTSARSGLRDI
jgi:5-methylcytosine-specific restriction protein A